MKLFVVIQTDFIDGRIDGNAYPFTKLQRTVEDARKQVEEANVEMWESLHKDEAGNWVTPQEERDEFPCEPVSWDETGRIGRDNEGAFDDWTQWVIEEVELDD